MLTFTSAVFAQRLRGERDHRPPRLEQMQEELQLSDDQLQQIETIQDRYREKIRALREQMEEDPAEYREAVRELLESQRAEIEQVLTEDQQAILEEKRKAAESVREERRAAKEQMHQKLKTYHEENILPVLKEQRAKLESQISNEDKATIAELRAEQQKMRDLRKAAKDDPANREAMADLRTQNREQMEQLKPLVEKYEEEIEGLFTEILDERQQWREDLKQLHEEFRPETREDRQARTSRRRDRFERGNKPHHKGPELEGMMGKIHFLLLDPNAPATESFDIDLPDPAVETEIFPNPARQINTINYKVEMPGEVTIVLRDGEGRLVQTLLDEYRTTGSHNLEVDLSGLANGVYYYTITSEDGTVTKKLVVAKE